MFSFVWPIDDSGKPFTLQTREPAIIEKRKARQSLIHNISRTLIKWRMMLRAPVFMKTH